MQRHMLPYVLVGLVLAGCSMDSSTDALSPHYDMVATPFGGRCELAIGPAQPIGPGVIRQVDIGECIVSRLGKSTFISDRVVNVVAGTQTVQNTLIAANGDNLYANGSGTNQLVAPGRVAFRADVTFQGGTGRFANASGGATIVGEANFAIGSSEFTITGTIAY